MLAESQRRMLTPAATAWIDEHLPADAIFWTDGLVIEPRFVATEPDGPVRRGPRRRRGRGARDQGALQHGPDVDKKSEALCGHQRRPTLSGACGRSQPPQVIFTVVLDWTTKVLK